MRWEYIGVDPITDMLPGLIRSNFESIAIQIYTLLV